MSCDSTHINTSVLPVAVLQHQSGYLSGLVFFSVDGSANRSLESPVGQYFCSYTSVSFKCLKSSQDLRLNDKMCILFSIFVHDVSNKNSIPLNLNAF